MQSWIKKKKTFSGLIKKRQEDLNITAKEARVRMGLSQTTYQRRVKAPETLTVLELNAFRRVYQLTDEEIRGVVDREYI